jgi:DHA1 family multidrug resistance protein-like MFS transporter
VTFTSAVFAPATNSASKELQVGSEVGALGTTLYVLGFASGPLISAPLSELTGRKWPLTIAMLVGGIFTIASAVAKDIQTLVICRFLAGVCAASQLTVVPGVLADVFDNTYRGMAITLYALTVFVGPFTAPAAGGFIVSSHLGWRWTLYIPSFLSLVNGGISFFFLPETYAPCILVEKAAAIRRQTGNWGIHSRYDQVEVDARELIDRYFTRPLKMLITEPIILLVSLYMSFIYGLVYCLLEAYPYVFEEVYGFSPGMSGLPFIGLIIGQVLAVSFILSQHSGYVEKLVKNDNVPVPEWRLAPTLFGAPIFAMGIFWWVARHYHASLGTR